MRGSAYKVVLAAVLAACRGAPAAAAPTLESEDDKTLYALGALLGKNIQDLHVTPAELQRVQEGLGDQALGEPARVDMGVYTAKAQQWGSQRRNRLVAAAAAERREKDLPFERAAARDTAARPLPGGAVLKTLVSGSGERPKPTDRVRISYEGRLVDGTVFDSTAKRGGEARVAMNELLPCLREGLEAMQLAETAELVCPASLAYGDPGHPPGVPGGAEIVFKVSLLEINPKLAPPGPKPRPKPEPPDRPGRSG